METPPQYVTKASYLPCRLPQFGLDHYALQAEYMPFEFSVKYPGGNLCEGGRRVIEYLHSTEQAHNVNQQCQDHHVRIARENLGTGAFPVCDNARFERCEFGGAASYLFYKVRLRFFVPVYNEHENDSGCPLAGPPEEQLVQDAVYRCCRHPLNGVEDSKAACGL